jgi:hypothetical protein
VSAFGRGRVRVRVRRIGLIVGMTLLFAFCAGLSLAIALDVGSEKPGGYRAAFAIVAGVFLLAIVRTLAVGVYVEPGGILIRNMMTTRRLAWTEIERFEMGEWRSVRGFPCGVARLKAGGQVTIYALNPPAMSEEAVLPLIDDLNERLGQATGRTFAAATL